MKTKFRGWTLMCSTVVWLATSAPAQVIQPLCYFTNSSFTSPRNLPAGLTLGRDGCLYGTTEYGGPSGDGTIFKMTPSGLLTPIANLDGTTGSSPLASLTLGPDGNFYGTASFLGAGSEGTVFQVTTNGAVNVLFPFKTTYYNNGITPNTNVDGAAPQAGLTLGPDGSFYGSTTQGGTNGGGTVFKITTNTVLTTLVELGNPNGSADTNAPGASPHGRMAFGPDGNLYGTTYDGGYQGNGTIFKMTTNGAFTTLFRFGSTNGSEPDGDLVLGPDQCFYGTTLNGGSGGDGTVFKVTTNGVMTTVVNFDFRTSNTPKGGLTLAPDGSFYGTLSSGNNSTNQAGAVFRLTTNGALTILANFNGTNGSEPEAPPTIGADGNLYGTTWIGGVDINAAGVIYRVNIAPTITNQLLGITMGADGTATLHLASTPGSTNRIWATTNLAIPMAQWQVLATNIATNSLFDFQDSNTSGNAMKFYRLSTP